MRRIPAIQVHLVLDQLRAILEAGSSSLADVVEVTAFLANREMYEVFKEVYSEYFPLSPPARTTVVVEIPTLGALLELDAIALSGGVPA